MEPTYDIIAAYFTASDTTERNYWVICMRALCNK